MDLFIWLFKSDLFSGTISSSNPTAQPADVLIQSAPPHRRARTPAWSYHFYPDETWVDLTLTLPCAVLLKEVQLQPHLTSLASEFLHILIRYMVFPCKIVVTDAFLDQKRVNVCEHVVKMVSTSVIFKGLQDRKRGRVGVNARAMSRGQD